MVYVTNNDYNSSNEDIADLLLWKKLHSIESNTVRTVHYIELHECCSIKTIKSSKPNDAYLRQSPGAIHVMAHRLFGTNQLTEPL